MSGERCSMTRDVRLADMMTDMESIKTTMPTMRTLLMYQTMLGLPAKQREWDDCASLGMDRGSKSAVQSMIWPLLGSLSSFTRETDRSCFNIVGSTKVPTWDMTSMLVAIIVMLRRDRSTLPTHL